MHVASCLLLATASFASVGPAAADAVVYRGTIGDHAVVLELTAPLEEGDPVAGRYAVMAEGIDIFLRDVSEAGGPRTLAEAAPCGEEGCPVGEDGALLDPPVAADWTLKPAAAGALTGTWTERPSGRTLPIALQRRARRPIDLSEGMLVDALSSEAVAADVGSFRILDPARFPYDFLKLDVPLRPGAETAMKGAVVRLDADERLELPYPVAVSLGGADVGPVNAYLKQQRFQFETMILSCGSQYKGVNFSQDDAATLREAALDIQATLQRVSPELIGYSESGSLFCGGAHPNNFITYRLVDARTGRPIIPESLLAGWTFTGRDGTPVDPAAYDNSDYSLIGAAGPDLLAYVSSRRVRQDAEREAECAYEDLIAGGNLGVYVTDDSLVFNLKDLPYVAFACGDDLLTVPLAEARPLLTKAALAYLPEAGR